MDLRSGVGSKEASESPREPCVDQVIVHDLEHQDSEWRLRKLTLLGEAYLLRLRMYGCFPPHPTEKIKYKSLVEEIFRKPDISVVVA